MKAAITWAIIFTFIGVAWTRAQQAAPDASDVPERLEASIRQSDDYLANKALFTDAATKLTRDFGCTISHLEENGGFMRSATATGRYFTYCGNYKRIDLTVIGEDKYAFKQQGRGSATYSIEIGEDAADMDITIKIAELEAKVRPIPASDFSANLDLYRQLLALDPSNERYKAKVAHYEAMDRADEQRFSAKVTQTPTQNLRRECANKITDWLTHNTAKSAIKKTLKAPRTARFSNYRTGFVDAAPNRCNYLVTVEVDAENSFGAMLRQSMTVAVAINPATLAGAGVVVQ